MRKVKGSFFGLALPSTQLVEFESGFWKPTRQSSFQVVEIDQRSKEMMVS